MNNKRITAMNTTIKGSLKKLSERISGYDKSILISIITGCIFILFAVIQLIFVISTPMARTFDHISLTLVDFIIAAICFVYVLYRQGMLGSFESERRATTTENDAKPKKNVQSETSDVTRVCIPSSRMQNNSRSTSSPSGVKSSRAAHTFSEENENLFSPRHRYSDAYIHRTQATGTRRTEHKKGSKFNSHHTGR